MRKHKNLLIWLFGKAWFNHSTLYCVSKNIYLYKGTRKIRKLWPKFILIDKDNINNNIVSVSWSKISPNFEFYNDVLRTLTTLINLANTPQRNKNINKFLLSRVTVYTLVFASCLASIKNSKNIEVNVDQIIQMAGQK